MPNDGGTLKKVPAIHGAGEYQYQITNDWPKVPPGMQWREVGSVAVDDKDQVYVFNRGPHPMMVFDREGNFLRSWGSPGTGPGEFNIPHNICCDADGWVYVADRESHRVQVFDGNGKFETQWNNLHRPSGIFMPPGKCPICYIGECGPIMTLNREVPNLGPRVSIVDNEGQLLARIGDISGAGYEPGQFISPHGIAVDSRGDVYVAEVSATAWPQLRPSEPVPNPLPSLRKMLRVLASRA